MNFTACTFYTPDYEPVARRLAESCEKHGITLIAEGVQNTGSWVKNCAFKPRFIQNIHNVCKTPVVWLDADAVVRQYPSEFDKQDCDMACHFREYNPRRGKELLSGTLYFAKNLGGKEILDLWVKQQEKCPDHWDQHTLDHVLKTNEGRWKIKHLPATYTQIFDSMKHNGKPVIEHFQESRKHKK